MVEALKIRTGAVARELSLDYECFCSDASEPELTSITFKEVLPNLIKSVEGFARLGECRLFRH